MPTDEENMIYKINNRFILDFLTEMSPRDKAIKRMRYHANVYNTNYDKYSDCTHESFNRFMRGLIGKSDYALKLEEIDMKTEYYLKMMSCHSETPKKLIIWKGK
jgi:hypothetical protein